MVTEGVFVIERSASPVIRTFVTVVALLLVRTGSGVVEELAEAVFVIGVVVPEVMFSGKLAVDPAVKSAIVQVTVPVPPLAGFEQLQPDGVVMDEKVVPVGIVSVNVTFKESLGPLLVKVCVYANAVFGLTVAAADAVIDRSASTATELLIVTLLLFRFGSVRVVEVSVTVPVLARTVPLAVLEARVTTTTNAPVDVPDVKLFPQVR